MGFVNYLLLGTLAYASGWAVRVYVLSKKPAPQNPYSLTHPVIVRYLAVFFAIMMVVSWLIGQFILGHTRIDVIFILVNSAVATFVFSFGLSPDHADYNVPD
ncbi:hypothetical protein [Psychrobacter sp. I-STPA6b]|uniref:hypothetical protein n=1 Tax=Psychrobacter sp. I-STPA6b TaxID=2585718 RepID=UPI001D0CD79A|nr:hypothetical protein [Psychrobacter sp. I-STPA6b]